MTFAPVSFVAGGDVGELARICIIERVIANLRGRGGVRGDHGLQSGHCRAAAAACDGHVFPTVTLFGEGLLDDVQRRRLATPRSTSAASALPFRCRRHRPRQKSLNTHAAAAPAHQDCSQGHFSTLPCVFLPTRSSQAPDPETVYRLPIVNVLLPLRCPIGRKTPAGASARNAATPSVRSWVNAVIAPASPRSAHHDPRLRRR